MILFAVGLVAIALDLVLFASGSRNLPLWINLGAMLAPVGLGLALISVYRENRQASITRSNQRAGTTRPNSANQI